MAVFCHWHPTVERPFPRESWVVFRSRLPASQGTTAAKHYWQHVHKAHAMKPQRCRNCQWLPLSRPWMVQNMMHNQRQTRDLFKNHQTDHMRPQTVWWIWENHNKVEKTQPVWSCDGTVICDTTAQTQHDKSGTLVPRVWEPETLLLFIFSFLLDRLKSWAETETCQRTCFKQFTDNMH